MKQPLGALALMLGVGLGRVADARPVEALEGERAAAAAELRDLDRRAGSLDEQLRLRQRMLRRRLRALYKMSQGGAFRLVVDARSLDDLDDRVAAAERVVSRDLQELGALDEELDELARDRARRDEELARDRAIDAGRGAAAEREMSGPAVGLLAARGALTRPVPGAITMGLQRVRVREPRAGAPALELPRRAVELSATPGEPVHAIAAGQVRWIGELDGLGRAVVIDHGDRYVSVTGHLGRVRAHVGARVRDGEVLGAAAGSAVSFELTEGKVPLDPARWLRPPAPPIAAAKDPTGKAATLGR